MLYRIFVVVVVFISIVFGVVGVIYYKPEQSKAETTPFTKEQFAATIEQYQQVCAKAKGQIYFETNSLGVVTVGCIDRAKINGTAM